VLIFNRNIHEGEPAMKSILTIAISLAAAIGLAACGPSSDKKAADGKTMSDKTEVKGMAPAPVPKQEAKPMDQSAMSKGDMKGMDMDMGGKSGSHQASASVKSVDAKSDTVTLDHGPVASMNWPAMTMTFKVRDKSMLDQLGVGKKVDVEFVQEGKDYVITSVR
jgi:Cu/Ag efflux protein CusF